RGVLDLLPLLDALASCPDAARGANLFHGTLAEALAAWVARAAELSGTRVVALGGGCFLNKVLTGALAARLAELGLTALTAARVSPGDAGVSLGQAWVAALTDTE
ncbi:MAG: hydrogenase maturation protein HypF, partial [Actinomycetota bacterium]